MLNAKAFANAASTVMGIWVVACVLLSFIAPDILFSVAQSWMHTINLETVKSTFSPDLGLMIVGFMSAFGLTWITTFGVISLYNKWTK